MAGQPPPGPGSYEVLSQGGDEPPRRLPPWLARLARVGVVLAGAILLLTQLDLTRPSDPPEPPEARTADGSRPPLGALAEPTGTAPSLTELAGVWLVDHGPPSFSPGRMWMAFHTDGSFRLDDRGALLSSRPWASGHFHLHGHDLVLVVEGGTGCRPGDRFGWRVAMLPGGRLRTEHVTDSGGRCRVVPGTWSARPLEDRDMVKLSWRG
jgi:hypothetical protein